MTRSGSNGSVVFEVWDGTSRRLFQSSVKTGADGPTAVAVDLAGVTDLRLVVTTGPDNNWYDHADWADATITCGDSAPGAPQPTMSSPAPGAHYRVGQTIQLSGSATDGSGVEIPSSGLVWHVIVQHCTGVSCHQHPLATLSGSTASFVAPDHDDGSYIEIVLTATDSSGRDGLDQLRRAAGDSQPDPRHVTERRPARLRQLDGQRPPS